MNIVTWMLENKYASHWKHAQHIIIGLRLGELHKRGEYDAIKARVILYRKWRDSGEPSKVAYRNAIEGKQPLELIPVEAAR